MIEDGLIAILRPGAGQHDDRGKRSLAARRRQCPGKLDARLLAIVGHLMFVIGIRFLGVLRSHDLGRLVGAFEGQRQVAAGLLPTSHHFGGVFVHLAFEDAFDRLEFELHVAVFEVDDLDGDSLSALVDAVHGSDPGAVLLADFDDEAQIGDAGLQGAGPEAFKTFCLCVCNDVLGVSTGRTEDRFRQLFRLIR